MLLSFMVLLSAEHILLLENQKERKTKVVDGLEPRVEGWTTFRIGFGPKVLLYTIRLTLAGRFLLKEGQKKPRTMNQELNESTVDGRGVLPPLERTASRRRVARSALRALRLPDRLSAFTTLGQDSHHNDRACEHESAGFGHRINAQNLVEISNGQRAE